MRGGAPDSLTRQLQTTPKGDYPQKRLKEAIFNVIC